MPERLEKLRATVQELESELQSLDTLDDEARALLREAADEIHSVLEEKDPSKPAPESLTERLTHSAQEFEAEHPTLSGVVNRIVEVLRQMGI